MMNDLMFAVITYIASDVLTLILGRFGLIQLKGPAQAILKEAINFIMDKDGQVHVKEKHLLKTTIRPATEEELIQLASIKRVSENQR